MKKLHRVPDFKPTEGRALIGLVESDTGQYLIAIHYSLSDYCSLPIFKLAARNMRVNSIALQLAETHNHVSPREKGKISITYLINHYTILVVVTNNQVLFQYRFNVIIDSIELVHKLFDLLNILCVLFSIIPDCSPSR